MTKQENLFETESRRTFSSFPLFCYRMPDEYINTPLVEPHWHNEMEMVYSEAKGILHINDEAFEMAEGDIFFINPRLIHRTYRISHGPMYHIVFDLNLLKMIPANNSYNTLVDDIMVQKRKFLEKPHRDSELYRDLLPVMQEITSLQEQTIPLGYESCRVMSQLYAVMAACYRADSFKYVNESSLYGMRYVTEIMEYINQNYQECLTVPLLAKNMNMSETYLYRLFRDYAGLTPVNYINSIRLKEAYRLLDEGKNVTETAVAVGIPNVSYFIKLFKGATGQTPHHWLKEKKEKT